MAEAGKYALVHYKGTLDDGSVFDSSEGRDPLKFIVGVGQVIPGFDKAVLEMEIGDEKTVKIPCAEAYGEYSEEAIQVVAVEQIPNGENLPVGKRIFFTGPDGQPFPALVKSIEDGMATFDFNHELAGKDLTFELKLVGIEDAPASAGCSSSCCDSCGDGCC